MSQVRASDTAGQTPSPRDTADTPLARGQAAEGTALLIIDMLGDWRFPGAEALLDRALAIAPAIQALKARCQRTQVPVIYANDNHGQWRSDFHTLVQKGLAAGGQRAQLAQALQPDAHDYFVLKPKQSAFFATPLDLLLCHLRVRRLIVTGTTTEQCVLATVIDARMRDYELLCPHDCLAAHSQERHAQALHHLTEVLQVDTTGSTAVDLPGKA